MIVQYPLPRAINMSRHQVQRLLTTTRIGRHQPARLQTYATIKTSPTTYAVTNVDGIKVAMLDDAGATTGLTVVLRAGSRYAAAPGLAHLLDKFAWKVHT